MRHITFMHAAPLWQEGGIPREDTEKINQARDRLSVALEQVPEGVEVSIEVPSGRPIDAILQTAKAHRADVIILGTPTRSLLNEKLFGSTAVGLSQKIAIPLVVLRPQLISAYTTEELDLRCRHLFRYLLVPYEGSATANYLVEQVQHYVELKPPQPPEACLLCWVINDAGRREIPKDYQKQEAQKILATKKSALEQLNLRVTTEVREGNPLTEILDAALMFDITAIAVCSDTLGKLVEWSVPSFTGELLRRSWHPVLFFPPKR